MGFVVLPLLILTGCVQVDSFNTDRSKQLAVSSVRDYPVTYPSGATFALAPRHTETHSMTQEQERIAYDVYGKEIIKYFKAKGYVYAADAKPDFYIGYGLGLEADLNDQKMTQKFGVLPGLKATNDLEKGSFIIYIEDSAMAKTVWRGAVQGFIQEEHSASEREQRAMFVVTTALRSFF